MSILVNVTAPPRIPASSIRDLHFHNRWSVWPRRSVFSASGRARCTGNKSRRYGNERTFAKGEGTWVEAGDESRVWRKPRLGTLGQSRDAVPFILSIPCNADTAPVYEADADKRFKTKRLVNTEQRVITKTSWTLPFLLHPPIVVSFGGLFVVKTNVDISGDGQCSTSVAKAPESTVFRFESIAGDILVAQLRSGVAPSKEIGKEMGSWRYGKGLIFLDGCSPSFKRPDPNPISQSQARDFSGRKDPKINNPVGAPVPSPKSWPLVSILNGQPGQFAASASTVSAVNPRLRRQRPFIIQNTRVVVGLPALAILNRIH
ncbi:hypothetical protein KM043_010914 [Ampulex compressa]|nr:hypothetical protein KM043_010914 [Ampulex compressa]